MAIPKVIHYCWFGGNKKSKLAEKCIKSWYKYCKDYEIIEWNESNFDIASSPLYVRQAYEAKKWAFITDYVRLWAMFNYGGIYMDADVEVIKSLDKFLDYDAFSGFEKEKAIPTGIMACNKNFSLFGELLEEYNNISFIKPDGSLDVTSNVVRITNNCLQKGLTLNGEFQIIDGFALFPKDYFCPKDYETGKIIKTKNTHTIHHFAESWISKENRDLHRKRQLRNKYSFIIITPRVFLRKVMGDESYEKLKRIFNR